MERIETPRWQRSIPAQSARTLRVMERIETGAARSRHGPCPRRVPGPCASWSALKRLLIRPLVGAIGAVPGPCASWSALKHGPRQVGVGEVGVPGPCASWSALKPRGRGDTSLRWSCPRTLRVMERIETRTPSTCHRGRPGSPRTLRVMERIETRVDGRAHAPWTHPVPGPCASWSALKRGHSVLRWVECPASQDLARHGAH